MFGTSLWGVVMFSKGHFLGGWGNVKAAAPVVFGRKQPLRISCPLFTVLLKILSTVSLSILIFAEPEKKTFIAFLLSVNVFLPDVVMELKITSLVDILSRIQQEFADVSISEFARLVRDGIALSDATV